MLSWAFGETGDLAAANNRSGQNPDTLAPALRHATALAA